LNWAEAREASVPGEYKLGGQQRMQRDSAAYSLLEELQGAQLSAVTFVQDYLQLWFDGPGINVMNPLTVRTSVATITAWQPGFRDLLCAQIAKIVAAVERIEGEALLLQFEDESEVSVSLREEDYRNSREAYYAHGFNNDASLVE
jgi:hypothetical protein